MNEINTITKYRSLRQAAHDMGIEATRLRRIRKGISRAADLDEIQKIKDYAKYVVEQNVINRSFSESKTDASQLLSEMLSRSLV